MATQTKRARGPAQKAEQAAEKQVEADKPDFIKVKGELIESASNPTRGELIRLELEVGEGLVQMIRIGGLGAQTAMGFLSYKRVHKDAKWDDFLELDPDECDFAPEENEDPERPTPPDSSEESTTP